MNIQTRAADLIAEEAGASLIWLLGQPHLEEYLSFVKRKVVGGAALSPRLLADEWRAANDHYYELEQREAGDADAIDVRPLPASMAALVENLAADRYYRATFDTLPTTVEMVELDRLVTWQGQIADRFATIRGHALGRAPTDEALFRFCFPPERDVPPITVRRLAADHFQFLCEATDFAARTPQLLALAQLDGICATGPLSAGIAVPLGFEANFLSAIRSDNRVLLHNGYHRAYALRALGFTHAPCIIQTVTRLDELKFAADPRVSGDPAFYFRAARPPMLRDFLNPRLAKSLTVRPIQTVIDVELKITSWSATDLCPNDPS